MTLHFCLCTSACCALCVRHSHAGPLDYCETSCMQYASLWLRLHAKHPDLTWVWSFLCYWCCRRQAAAAARVHTGASLGQRFPSPPVQQRVPQGGRRQAGGLWRLLPGRRRGERRAQRACRCRCCGRNAGKARRQCGAMSVRHTIADGHSVIAPNPRLKPPRNKVRQNKLESFLVADSCQRGHARASHKTRSTVGS